jgi:hypothetical protein
MKAINGDSIESPTIYTRTEAGMELVPPVSARQVQEYLNIARLFVPGFDGFNGLEGGLSNAPIKPIHIPTLQKIREYVRETKSLVKARIKIAEEYKK